MEASNQHNEYEKARLERIAVNKKRLEEMLQPCQVLLDEIRAPRKLAISMPRPLKPRSERAFLPERRSARVARLEPKLYREVDTFFDDRPLKRETVRAKRTSKATYASHSSKSRGGWRLAMGLASREASDRAREAALKLIEELRDQNVGCALKEMSSSQVSGGFWCQLPRGFHDHFLYITDHTNIVLLHECWGKEHGWEVVYLNRTEKQKCQGGHSCGFSGGWRGFAIDQRLYPNDSVVLEKVDRSTIRAHIFRAFQYEDPDTVQAILKENHMTDDLSAYREALSGPSTSDTALRLAPWIPDVDKFMYLSPSDMRYRGEYEPPAAIVVHEGCLVTGGLRPGQDEDELCVEKGTQGTQDPPGDEGKAVGEADAEAVDDEEEGKEEEEGPAGVSDRTPGPGARGDTVVPGSAPGAGVKRNSKKLRVRSGRGGQTKTHNGGHGRGGRGGVVAGEALDAVRGGSLKKRRVTQEDMDTFSDEDGDGKGAQERDQPLSDNDDEGPGVAAAARQGQTMGLMTNDVLDVTRVVNEDEGVRHGACMDEEREESSDDSGPEDQEFDVEEEEPARKLRRTGAKRGAVRGRRGSGGAQGRRGRGSKGGGRGKARGARGTQLPASPSVDAHEMPKDKEAEEPELFVVEKIMDYRKNDQGDFEFFVRWKGYGPEEDTWEPLTMFGTHPRFYEWEGGLIPSDIASLVPNKNKRTHNKRATV